MQEATKIQQLLSKKRVIWAIAICLVATGTLFYFETKDKDLSFDQLRFSGASVLYLFLALLMMAFRDLGYIVRIRLLTDKLLNWRQSFNVTMVWEFASALTPGVVGGSAVAMFILQKEKIPLGKSTALVMVTLIMDNLFYLVFLPLIFLFVSSEILIPHNMSWLQGDGIYVVWMGYSVIMAITLLLVISLLFAPGLIKAIFRLIFKLPFLRKRKANGEQIGRDVIVSSKELRGKSFSYWAKIFLVTIWAWTSRYLVINFLLLAFLEVGLCDHLVILGRQLVMWLIMLVTPTPGGSGMAEFLFSEFLSNIVANGALVVSLALLWRIISYYPYLIIGSIILPRWLRK